MLSPMEAFHRQTRLLMPPKYPLAGPFLGGFDTGFPQISLDDVIPHNGSESVSL